MIVQPVVEGQGDELAVPVLLRRLVALAQAWEVAIVKPHRRKRSALVQQTSLRNAIRVARLTPDCGAILVIFDADDDCPKDLAPRLAAWAAEAAHPVPCEVVMATREYEAWLLAGLASLRGTLRVRADADDHPEPEQPRDAKGQLEMRMLSGSTYIPTVDQASWTASFDIAAAYRTCRSFRKLTTAFGALLAAANALPATWPPADWRNP